MLEENLRKLVEEYSDIIDRIESFELVEEERISKLKAKLRLFDGSFLWVREIWIKGEVKIYSYYWLRADQSLIIGWDNAPHYKELRTFPHHRHEGNTVKESDEKYLKDVLEYIRKFFR